MCIIKTHNNKVTLHIFQYLKISYIFNKSNEFTKQQKSYGDKFI